MHRGTPSLGARVETRITPPKLASFPAERMQLEYSSRSMIFRSDGDRIVRAWGSPDRPWPLAVEPEGSRWKVTAWGASAPEACRAARELFSLDHPIEEFYRQVRNEPMLRGTDRRFRGLRIPRDPCVFESLVYSVIGQQLSVAAANTIKNRLFEKAGAFLEVDGLEIVRVPSPAEIQGLGESALRSVGLSRAKTSSILALAQRHREGAFDGELLARLPREEAVARLDAERGVGPWTAENALLRGVGRRDLFIAGDLGIRAAMAAYRIIPFRAPEARVRAWAERAYPGWGSYATLYLWRKWVADGAPVVHR